MNRRQFLSRLAATMTVVAVQPKLPALLLPAAPEPVEPKLVDFSDMLDAFAQIHEQNLQVDFMFMHPRDYARMLGVVNKANWIDQETNRELLENGVMGYVWDAVLKTDENMRQGEVVLIGEAKDLPPEVKEAYENEEHHDIRGGTAAGMGDNLKLTSQHMAKKQWDRMVITLFGDRPLMPAKPQIKSFPYGPKDMWATKVPKNQDRFFVATEDYRFENPFLYGMEKS